MLPQQRPMSRKSLRVSCLSASIIEIPHPTPSTNGLRDSRLRGNDGRRSGKTGFALTVWCVGAQLAFRLAGRGASSSAAAQVVFIALSSIGAVAAGDFPQSLGKPDVHVRRFPDTAARGAAGSGPASRCDAPADGHPRLVRGRSSDRGGRVRGHLDRPAVEAGGAHRCSLGARDCSPGHRHRRMAGLPEHPSPVRDGVRTGRPAVHRGRHLPRIPAIARPAGTVGRREQQAGDGPVRDRDRRPRLHRSPGAGRVSAFHPGFGRRSLRGLSAVPPPDAPADGRFSRGRPH